MPKSEDRASRPSAPITLQRALHRIGAMRIGVLTGGGDCPGLNAVIRAVVRKAIDSYGDEIVGFRDGWRGVLEDASEPLTIESTRGILPRGGTILGSSRTNPFAREPDPGDAVRHRRGLSADPAPPRTGTVFLDRGCRGGRQAEGAVDGDRAGKRGR